MKTILIEIELLIDKGELEKAEELLSSHKGGANATFWLLSGKIYQKNQQWGKAINALQRALTIDPINKEAKLQIEIIRNILNFSNPEMFNP